MDGFFDFIELRIEEKTLHEARIFGLDVETTGLDRAANEIIEIGICSYDAQDRSISPVYQSYVKPHQEIKPFITSLTGITEEDVKDAKGIDEVLEEVLPLIRGGLLVMHNADFDLGFLKKFAGEQFLKDNDIAAFDTLKLSKNMIQSSRYSLEYLVDSLGLGHENHHRAADDAVMCIRLFDHLIQREPQFFSQKISGILNNHHSQGHR